MEYARLLLLLPPILPFTINCIEEDYDTLIQDLLKSLVYAADRDQKNHYASTLSLADKIPYVRWARWIERPVIREYDIIIIGDSADVTIRAYFHGEPPCYGFFVISDPMNPVYQREIANSAVRKVKLWKDAHDRWRLVILTLADIHTDNTMHRVTIDEVRTYVASKIINSWLMIPTPTLRRMNYHFHCQ